MNEKEEEKKPVKTIHIDVSINTNTKTNISTILTNSLDTVQCRIHSLFLLLSFFLSVAFFSLTFLFFVNCVAMVAIHLTPDINNELVIHGGNLLK